MVSLATLVVCSFIFLSIPASSQNDGFIYTRFNERNDNISLTGVATVTGRGILQLTNQTRRLMGHAFYSSPLQFKNSSNGSAFSFSTCFAFAIVPEYEKLGGHGFAFAISQSVDFTAALPSQYLGLLNATDVGNFSNHLFAVEFDTVQDFEFGDINDNHVGIDLNSLVSNKSAAAAFFSDDSQKQDLNLKNGKVILAWVEYDSGSNLLNVTLSPSSSKPKIPLFSYRLDLSAILKESMYVGFSASTGLLSSSHYILGWSFQMNGEAKSFDLDSLPLLPGIKKTLHVGFVVTVSVLGVVFVLLSIFVGIYVYKKMKNGDVIESWELEIGPHRYSYLELKKATGNFKEKELLGQGGFGQVYKGILPSSKTEVAVKRISNESKQGLREFVSEISTIGRLRHRNLVQLLGWCRKRGDLLLVYDFMPNGSLDRFLFDRPRREHGTNLGTTKVVGTLGYIAPELTKTGKATTKSDVYAFGAFLLEVVCGRRPIETKARIEEMVLVDWVWVKFKEGNVVDVVDWRMRGNFDESQVVMVLRLGLMCSGNEPSARPSIRQVLSYLDGECEMPAEVVVEPDKSSDVGFFLYH
nr:L-type lectin-domain containing receptor kinase S.4-like [Ipomoea trifida]